jgi:hypothetical protein
VFDWNCISYNSFAGVKPNVKPAPEREGEGKKRKRENRRKSGGRKTDIFRGCRHNNSHRRLGTNSQAGCEGNFLSSIYLFYILFTEISSTMFSSLNLSSIYSFASTN